MNEFIISSDLTYTTVSAQLLRLRHFMINTSKKRAIIINLAIIKRSDSAGVAWMIEALRLSRDLNKDITFIAVPDQMLNMMRFCNILSLFTGKLNG